VLKKPFRLDASVVLITGASRGIGEATAVAMGEAGADVVLLARSVDELEATATRVEETGADAVVCPGDVTSDEDITAAFDTAERRLGDVDVLINNAGVNPFFGNALNLDIETLEQILSVNVTGSFRCSLEFARRVDEREAEGAIVNIASVGGVVALPYQTPYTASKHALVGMTKCLAVEWAPDIRVNALAPGYVATEFTKGVRENESIREDILETIPQARFAEPEEIAHIAVYLASDAATYVTGEIHVADGGMVAR
jgi:NAD(P)-dependent dehydrogenase (short-subunit alcohol dehydrogenase family)